MNKNLIILTVYNNAEYVDKVIMQLTALKDTDVLIVDDGSTDGIFEVIEELKSVKYIKHDESLGYGASFRTGYEFARDMGYECMLTLDPENYEFSQDISEMQKNIDYGYDIVTCSRILENFNYQEISGEDIKIIETLAGAITGITEFNITDPFSEIKAYRVKSLENMEFTEHDHGILIQIFIQAAYYGLTILEIPAYSGTGFGQELQYYDDPLGMFLSLIETEKHLYSKGNIN